MWQERKRGVIFDVGHGGGSFLWRIAVPAIKEGFLPDSISTDLHISSMNTGMKDMLNVMDKFLAMGLSLDDVIAKSTWNPARESKQDGLGRLSIGADAEVAGGRVPEEARGGGRGGRGRDRAIAGGCEGPRRQASEEGVSRPQRQAARSGESTALQRHGVVRQPGVHLGDRIPPAGRHHAAHDE